MCIQVELTKKIYIETLFKVQFRQVYTGFRFIEGSVYSGFWFIEGSD
jgi:hypothetical protein